MVRIDPKRMDCICCDAELDRRAKKRPRPVANANTVPVAISRWDARLPKAPIISAPPNANVPRPRDTGRPSNTAPVAPGNPICARAWAANVDCLAIVKYPITPAATAMHNPATKALVIKDALST